MTPTEVKLAALILAERIAHARYKDPIATTDVEWKLTVPEAGRMLADILEEAGLRPSPGNVMDILRTQFTQAELEAR